MDAMVRAVRWMAELGGVVAFAGMFGAIFLQIIARYVFDSPLGWTDEVAAILFVWVVFWSGGNLIRSRDHIRFTLLADALPRRWRIRTTAVLTAFFGLLYLAATPVVFDYLLFASNQNTVLLEISLGFVYTSFGIFFAAVTIRFLLETFSTLRSWRRNTL